MIGNKKNADIIAQSLDRFVTFYQVDDGSPCAENATDWKLSMLRTRDAVIVSVL